MNRGGAARWLLRGILALAALLLLAGTGVWWLLHGSLAELDGERPLPGLAQPAVLDRDLEGAATILAATRTDALRVLGFLHAQERYFEMDLMRRSSAGELAALFGPRALELDRERRLHRFRDRASAFVAAEPAPVRAVLAAYTEGVNAGLAALAVRPWPYLLLGKAPRPWREEDSALVALAMFIDLHDETNERELRLWRLSQAVPPALFAALAADGTPWDAPLSGDPRLPPQLPRPSAIDLRPSAGASARLAPDTPVVGSNNFAVAGALTADGRALVANDMHLGLRVPNLWLRLRLRYDGVDATGLSLPGVPGIVAGSNGRVAWGFTNSYGDWLDFVRVQWTGPERSRYRTADGDEALALHRETIEVAGGSPVPLEVRETRWGPVLHDLDDGSSLALAWTAHRRGGVDLGLERMLAATSVDEAVRIVATAGMPPQNLLVADADGRIAWTIAGRIPRRTGDCDPRFPLDPLAGCDWDGWIDPAQQPRLADPVAQRLWTANSRVADGEALQLIGDGGYDLGARQRQIRDALFDGDRFAEQDLLRIQLDDRALFLEPWWHLLRQQIERDPHGPLAPLDTLTRNWAGRAAVDAVDYRLVRAFRLYVHEAVLESLVAAAADPGAGALELPRLPQAEGLVWALLEQRPAHLLTPPHGDWDAVLDGAARRVVDELGAQPGGLPARSWGERNTASIRHPLAAALPGSLAAALDMPSQPLPGDANMPRVQAPSFGASERFVVAPGREGDGLMHLPGGASGHPLSPFHGAGHAAWVEGRATPFLPGAARHRLALQPAR